MIHNVFILCFFTVLDNNQQLAKQQASGDGKQGGNRRSKRIQNQQKPKQTNTQNSNNNNNNNKKNRKKKKDDGPGSSESDSSFSSKSLGNSDSSNWVEQGESDYTEDEETKQKDRLDEIMVDSDTDIKWLPKPYQVTFDLKRGTPSWLKEALDYSH